MDELRDPLGDLLGFQLRRAAAAVSLALTRELEPLGLTPGDAGLLLLVGANEGITQTAIARMTRTQPANLVPLIAKLTRSDALVRAPGWGRAISLSLTAEGWRLHDGATAAFAAVEERLAEAVPAAQRGALNDLLGALTHAACHGAALAPAA